MSRHINKDQGDNDKVNLSSFLRIRRKTIIQFLNEREIVSYKQFQDVLKDNLNNYFYISNDLLKEIKKYFNSLNELKVEVENEQNIEENGTSQKKSNKSRTKKLTQNND